MGLLGAGPDPQHLIVNKDAAAFDRRRTPAGNSRPEILMFINAKSIQNVWRYFRDTMSPCLGGFFVLVRELNYISEIVQLEPYGMLV